MSLNRSTWRWNLQTNLLISPKLQQDYHPRKVLTPRLGVNVEATKEKRKVKLGDEVRYHERICKITYIQADGSVNLTAFKGAPFNSKFTPIADLEFPNEDGVFGEVEAIDLDIEPTVIVAPVKPAVRKLLIRPDESVVIFDYATLTVEARVVVQQKTGEIRDHIDTMKRSAIAIGQRLIEVKAQLNHGQWGAWLRTEFNWSDQTALNYMNEARLAGQIPNYLESEDRFNQTALAALAAKSTPRAAQEEAIKVAESLPPGEKLTLSQAEQIITEAKQAAAQSEVGEHDSPLNPDQPDEPTREEMGAAPEMSASVHDQVEPDEPESLTSINRAMPQVIADLSDYLMNHGWFTSGFEDGVMTSKHLSGAQMTVTLKREVIGS